MKPLYVTFAQLSQALKISIPRLRGAYRRGEFPALRLNRVIRFKVEAVKKALEKRQHVAAVAQEPDRYAAFRARIRAALDGRTAAGASRRRAHPNAPGQVKQGRLSQARQEERSRE